MPKRFSSVFSWVFFYQVLNVGGKLWADTTAKTFSFFKGAHIAMEVSPELLGVGYIIGPRIASIMVAGGVLASFVLTLVIKLFGDSLTTPLYPGTKLISEMSLREIWGSYILYIGAGAVAAAGLLSLFRSLPIIVRSAAAGFSGLKKTGIKNQIKRTERDLSMKFVFGSIGFLILAIWLAPQLQRQRGQVHRARHDSPGRLARAVGGPRVAAVPRERHRHRHVAGADRAAVRSLRPGRGHHRPPVRRHRAGPDDQPAARPR